MSNAGKKRNRYANLSVLDDTEELLKTADETKGVSMKMKAIPVRDVVIARNQRQFKLTPQDIDSEGKLVLSDNDSLSAQKAEEYDSLLPMAESIKEKGVINPISVYYEKGVMYLKSGQRRLLSSIIAGNNSIIARVWEGGPGEYDLEIEQWVENFHSASLNTKDTISAIVTICGIWEAKNGKKISASRLAKQLYCSKTQAHTYLTIINGPSDIVSAIERGELTNLKKAFALARIEDEDQRTSLLKKVISGEVTQLGLENVPPKSEQQEDEPRSAISKISLGHSTSIHVVKKLLTAVLTIPDFKELGSDLNIEEINDSRAATKAFKKIIKSLEKLEHDR